MRVLTFTIATILCSLFSNVSAQGWWDYSNGMEFIFSSANIEGEAIGTNYGGNSDWSSGINTNNQSTPVRYTMGVHFQTLAHYNFSESAGLFTGLTCRNVGFVQRQEAQNGNPEYISKYRTYTLGIPLGFKIGNMKKHFSLYAGAEAGFAFNYKEKHYRGGNSGDKDSKTTSWFSGRTNWWLPQLFVGLQLPGGANLKFAYYPTNFFNEDYSESYDGSTYRPYEGVTANMFYFSTSFQLFKSDLDKIQKEKEKNSGGATAWL